MKMRRGRGEAKNLLPHRLAPQRVFNYKEMNYE
jgi:hypothetical protein